MKTCNECGVTMGEEPGDEHAECPPGCEWNERAPDGSGVFCNDPGGEYVFGEYTFCAVHGQIVARAA